jgi:MerR family transcriptional regulator, redox-sensitive transcriptional activator SoxR
MLKSRARPHACPTITARYRQMVMDAFDWHEAGLTVGQVAERSGAAPSALRFYERQGLIGADRTASNQRRYHGDVLCRVAMIRVCQQAGLSLAQIKLALAEAVPDSRPPGPQEWEKLAQHLRKQVTSRISELDRLLGALAGQNDDPSQPSPPAPLPSTSPAPTRTHGATQIHPICTTVGPPDFRRAATPNGG